MVRDSIVIGVRNPQIREKLIQVGSELQLEKGMEKARTHELPQVQAKSMAGENPLVNYVHKEKPHTQRKRFNKSERKQQP